jgi:hypothetical protein
LVECIDEVMLMLFIESVFSMVSMAIIMVVMVMVMVMMCSCSCGLPPKIMNQQILNCALNFALSLQLWN